VAFKFVAAMAFTIFGAFVVGLTVSGYLVYLNGNYLS